MNGVYTKSYDGQESYLNIVFCQKDAKEVGKLIEILDSEGVRVSYQEEEDTSLEKIAKAKYNYICTSKQFMKNKNMLKRLDYIKNNELPTVALDFSGEGFDSQFELLPQVDVKKYKTYGNLAEELLSNLPDEVLSNNRKKYQDQRVLVKYNLETKVKTRKFIIGSVIFIIIFILTRFI